MTRYVAFIRGLNANPGTRIKMKQLESIFITCGFSGILTYGGSGNVVFDSDKDEREIADMIRSGLRESIGYDTKVFLRTMSHLKNLVECHPFINSPENDLYVSFLEDDLSSDLSLSGYGYEVNVRGYDAFISSHRVDGRRLVEGVEGLFGAGSTARSWRVIERIVSLG